VAFEYFKNGKPQRWFESEWYTILCRIRQVIFVI
jgi:hypothetical protein